MKLYPFQQESVKKLCRFLTDKSSHAAYLGSDMGTGKTAVALGVSNRLDFTKAIIVCPAIMRDVWAQEIYKWLGAVSFKNPYIIYSSKNLDKERLKYADFVIVSYALTTNKKVLKFLCSVKYSLAIYDEAIALKTRKSLRTRACLIDLWKRAEHRLALCGTPITQSVMDLYTLCRKMHPEEETFQGSKVFGETYAYARNDGFSIKYYGLKNADKLKRIMRKNFFHRVTKEEALPELPAKIWQEILLPQELSIIPKAKDEKARLEQETEALIQAIETGKSPVIPKSLAEHRRLQGERKVASVVEFIEPMLEADIPVVCFFWHRAVGQALHEAFSKYKPALVTGETPNGYRVNAITDFQNGKTDLYLGSIAASGMGVTLTRSSTVVFAELSYSPADIDQAAARCHRIGTKDTVNIYSLIVKNSIDEKVSNIVLSKVRVINEVMDKNLSQDKLRD